MADQYPILGIYDTLNKKGVEDYYHPWIKQVLDTGTSRVRIQGEQVAVVDRETLERVLSEVVEDFNLNLSDFPKTTKWTNPIRKTTRREWNGEGFDESEFIPSSCL